MISGSCSKAFRISTACSCFSQNRLKALYSDSWDLLLQREAGKGGAKLWAAGASFLVGLAGGGAAAAIAVAVVDAALGASWFSTFLLSGELLGGGEEYCVWVTGTAGFCEAAGACEVWATIWAMASTMGRVCSGLALAACSCSRTLASTERLVGGLGLASGLEGLATEAFPASVDVRGVEGAAWGVTGAPPAVVPLESLATSVADSPDLSPQAKANMQEAEYSRP